eukprot:1149389-Pelagomonas_calceolata.AAC.7
MNQRRASELACKQQHLEVSPPAASSSTDDPPGPPPSQTLLCISPACPSCSRCWRKAHGAGVREAGRCW